MPRVRSASTGSGSGTSVAFADRGNWATTTAYAVGDVVTQNGARYICETAHTSGTFATDLAASKWVLLQVAGATKLTPTGTKTAPYNAVVGDLAVMNVAGGGTVLNLPSGAADKDQIGYIALGATTAVPLAINRGGADTIGTAGATSASIPLAGETNVFQYDAANTRWLSVANVKPLAALDLRYQAAFTDSGIWTATTVYALGAVATWLQTRYLCSTAHTSGATLDSSKWVVLGDAPINRAIEGAKIVGYGSSYMLGSNAANVGVVPSGSVWHLGGQSFLEKIGARHHSSQVINDGQASTWAQDIVGNLYGGGNSLGTNNAFRGTNTQVNTDRMAVICTLAENDVFSGTANAQALVALNNALKSIYYLVKGGTLVDDQSWSTPFTSTADVWCSSQHYGETTTQNAVCGTSFTGTNATIVLIGYNDSTGGIAQVQVDGSTVATVNLASQATSSAVRTRVQVPVRVSGLTNAAHTVTVTKTDATGTKVGVDCLIGPSTTQGALLVWVKPSYDNATGRLATVNAQIDATVTALGGTNNQFVVVDPSVEMDTASMILALHPNDKGHSHYANRVMDEITRAGVTWFDGLNRATT